MRIIHLTGLILAFGSAFVRIAATQDHASKQPLLPTPFRIPQSSAAGRRRRDPLTRWTPIIFCLCLGVGSTVSAQELAPNMRVRVGAPTVASKPIVGTITAVEPSVLIIQTTKERTVISRAAITTIDLSTQRSTRWRGAGRGALAGVAAAVVLGLTINDGHGGFIDIPTWLFVTVYAAATVPAGAGIGAAIADGERWSPMPLGSVRVPEMSAGHTSRRVQLGYSFRF